LFTAQVGIFRIRFWLLLLAAFDLAAFLIAFARWRRRSPTLRSPSCRFAWKDLGLLPLVAFAFWMMNRPAEYVAAYRDPGEYVNIAIKLADSLSLRIRDPSFKTSTTQRSKHSSREPLEHATFPEVLPGFYLATGMASYAAVLPPLPTGWRSVSLCGLKDLCLTCCWERSAYCLSSLAEQLFSSRCLLLPDYCSRVRGPGLDESQPFSEIPAQACLRPDLLAFERTSSKGYGTRWMPLRLSLLSGSILADPRRVGRSLVLPSPIAAGCFFR
jgi:hypothetical protein